MTNHDRFMSERRQEQQKRYAVITGWIALFVLWVCGAAVFYHSVHFITREVVGG